MANPDPYNRTFSFNDFQASNPSSPLPGNSLDNELENVEAAINGTQTALEDIRRSDGALKNGIVTVDSLDATVAAGVGTGALASAQAAANSAGAAADSADAAAGSASAAASSASAASGYAGNALTSRNEAEAEKILAQTARTGAQAARDFAAAWATAGEGVDVDDGVNPVGKSSYHWAQVALGAAAGALPDNSVGTSVLQDEAVTPEKLAAGSKALIGARFDTVAYLLADNTVIGYSDAVFEVAAGDIVEAGGFRYEVVASDATVFDEETAGGVRLIHADANMARDDLSDPDPINLPAIFTKNRLHDNFSVMEVFDTNTQREAIRDRAADFDCGPYINIATDYAKRRGYEVVDFPFGTYLLQGTRYGDYSRSLLIARSGLTLRGVYGKSIIKVDDGVTNPSDTTTTTGSIPTSDYRILCAEVDDVAEFLATPVDDLTVECMRFDGNGINNTVVSSVGANIRRAYMGSFGAGDRIKFHRNIFENCPGRNALQFGLSEPDKFHDCEVSWNVFHNMGDTIPGNGGQNDHSSVFAQFSSGKVVHNTLYNDAPSDPNSMNNCALEVHGHNTEVAFNQVRNYRIGGNVVALDELGGSVNNRWHHNDLLVQTVGLALWSFNFATGTWAGASSEFSKLALTDNTITLDTASYDYPMYGILQQPATNRTQAPLEDSRIEGNGITATQKGQAIGTTVGIELCSLSNVAVERNAISDLSGSGIIIRDADLAGLDVSGMSVKHNRIKGCGRNASRPWGLYVVNADSNKAFENIDIDDNTIEAELNPVGQAAPLSRGVRVTGPGLLRDIRVGAKNKFRNIQRAQRVEFTSTLNNTGVTRQPRIVPTTNQADPRYGHFEPAGERTEYMVPSAGNFIGRVPTTAGAASQATWSPSTAFWKGQWVKLANGRVIEYTTSGTSGGTEPNPTSLMVQYADGTAEFVYQDSVSAAFKTWGAISA